MVVHAYYPLGETRVQREALALVGAGYQVDVISLRKEGEPKCDRLDGVNIYRLPVGRHKGAGPIVHLLEYLTFFLLASAKVLSLHVRQRYCVVQSHNLPDFLVFVGLVPKLMGARLILDIHDLMPEFYAASFETDMASLPVRLLTIEEQLSCRFADRVIVVTENARQSLIGRGTPSTKVSVVMNVADSRIFYRAPNGRPPTPDTEQFNLIYHGTLTYRYGVDLLVRAVDQVRKRIPGVHLSILGAGELRDELEALITELDLHEHVYLSADVIEVTELPELIRQAHAGVVPNRSNLFTDGLLPTKLMEYVALGVPAIAARTPTVESYFNEAMVEFFTPGDVEDLANTICRLHADNNRREALIERSDEFNQTYSWPTVAAGYIALVDQLCTKQ
jgi:glycosyltransferase involved in cell wall biosynthesis